VAKTIIRVITHKKKNNYVLTLESENHGQLDQTNQDELKAILKEAVKAGNSNIVLNLQRINYMDSVIIGLLVEIFNELRDKGGLLAFANIHSRVKKIFDVTNLTQYFTVYKNIKEVE